MMRFTTPLLLFGIVISYVAVVLGLALLAHVAGFWGVAGGVAALFITLILWIGGDHVERSDFD